MPDKSLPKKFSGILLAFEIPVDIDYADILRRSSTLYEGVGEAVLIPEDGRPYVVLNCNRMTDRRKCETMLEEVKAAVDKIYDKYNRKGKENKEEATAVAGCRVGE
jgi:hypothetical protein